MLISCGGRSTRIVIMLVNKINRSPHCSSGSTLKRNEVSDLIIFVGRHAALNIRFIGGAFCCRERFDERRGECRSFDERLVLLIGRPSRRARLAIQFVNEYANYPCGCVRMIDRTNDQHAH